MLPRSPEGGCGGDGMIKEQKKHRHRRVTLSGPPKSTAAVALNQLPPDLQRTRVIGTAEAAALNNFSIPHWRRLYRTGKVPKPIRISDRKFGWRLGDLIDFIEARAAS